MDHPRTAPPAVDEVAAGNQDKALAVVQRLLKKRGIRARCHHRISLGLFAAREDEAGRPDELSLRSWMDRYPPELAVFGSQGWRDATVMVGPRSVCYLVAVRGDTGAEMIRCEDPVKVVDLILAAGRK
ncbi:hypothetical protein [Streptosporangium subroseum]|uniref:hypothetical protein n=1 Tax=Streptosporangium subroseum TaxID=106412 RepID=UPI00308B068C|nr:hypothetical protein OHB15_05895 [Streptosporangium subroseum]